MSVLDRHCFFFVFIFSKIVTNTEDMSIPLHLVSPYLCNIGRINKLKNMKKLFLIPLMLLATFMLTAACSEDEPLTDEQEQTTPEKDDGEEGGNVEGGNGRYLVLYCSRTGNTERMAQTIQSALDCDMIVVEPETPYEDDYNVMLDRAQVELDAIAQGNYPAITTSVESFDTYDIVFIGYPIWYSHIATPMQTFLHNHADLLAGKRIALFASSGSSGIGTSERDAATLVPDAVFEESLLLTSSTLGSMATRIPQWLESLGASREEPDTPDAASLHINIIVGEQTITATMEDNGAARDFLSRLPLEVTLEDYNNGTEKIFYPDPELNLDDTPRGCAPVAGDITIYEPWGNVAIFCRDWSESSSLIKIGHIDGDGISLLQGTESMNVRFERQ